MKAAWTMWKNTRMIILVAVCAAIYGAALIAFKTALPIIPGFTELRVANIFPMVFGLLFGPAGAWGTAIGNFMGDLFGGTIGPGSIPGFVGNFLLGYLPYAMWTRVFPFRKISREWKAEGSWRWINYFLLTKMIALNNTLASWIGVVLLVSVFSATRDHLGLFWADVMDEGDIGKPIAGTFGAWLVIVASVVGLLGGVITGLPGPTLGWISLLGILVGSFLL
jgi:energy-coupling factor transport system substrate-specific component